MRRHDKKEKHDERKTELYLSYLAISMRDTEKDILMCISGRQNHPLSSLMIR